MPNTVTRPYFCVHCDDWADHPTHEHRKTSRRVGKRGKVVLIYLTAEALEAYQSIPDGEKSKVAQAAFIEYAKRKDKLSP